MTKLTILRRAHETACHPGSVEGEQRRRVWDIIWIFVAAKSVVLRGCIVVAAELLEAAMRFQVEASLVQRK
jgi:hypothetical protein